MNDTHTHTHEPFAKLTHYTSLKKTHQQIVDTKHLQIANPHTRTFWLDEEKPLGQAGNFSTEEVCSVQLRLVLDLLWPAAWDIWCVAGGVCVQVDCWGERPARECDRVRQTCMTVPDYFLGSWIIPSGNGTRWKSRYTSARGCTHPSVSAYRKREKEDSV